MPAKQTSKQTVSQLKKISETALKEAKKQGASSAEVGTSVETGFSVTVRKGTVDTLEYNHDKGLGVTVYFGQCKGSASTTDTSLDAVAETVKAACEIAKVTAEDECSGLAEKKLMAKDFPDLDLNHPWGVNPEQGIEIAKQCEAAGLKFDKQISNSEGATLSSHEGFHIYANSHGFVGNYTSTRHSATCVLLAKQGSSMQRDYYYTVARDADDLESFKSVGKKAAERTLRKLGAKKVKTCQVPVIFEADIAAGLISSFTAAISGGNLYRKSSFLVDHLDKQIFPKHINIYQRPLLKKALGSASFDGDGVATMDRDYIKEGVLKSYILGTYSARRLGMQTTGNSGGVYNLFISTSDYDLPALLKKMGTGILVTEMMGSGINLVTGDYSRGAFGFWVENGELQYPIEEFTIAGNLKDMFKNLVAVGNDVDHRKNKQTGSILLEQMTIAGN